MTDGWAYEHQGDMLWIFTNTRNGESCDVFITRQDRALLDDPRDVSTELAIPRMRLKTGWFHNDFRVRRIDLPDEDDRQPAAYR